MHVNQLPHEILSYIFTTIANDISANPTCLFPITNVCSKWRTVGLSTGNLWSRIVFTYPLSRYYPLFLVTLLKRSGSYPLDILMDLRDPNWGWDEDTHNIGQQEMKNIVMLLLPHAQRWRRLELLTDTWAPIFAFLGCTHQIGSVPMLEKLYLSRCNAYFAARGQAFEPSLLGEPLTLFGGLLLQGLQSLSLVGVHLDWDQFPRLPNLHLLEFKYHAASVTPSFQQFQSMLDKCPQLSDLTVYGWGPIIDAKVSQDNRIQLPNIVKFSFGVLDTIYAIRFLSLLDLPSLDCLVLEDVSRAVYPTDPADTTLLFQWFCSRANRSIMPYASAPEFSETHFPLYKITSLELREICTTTAIFRAFLQEVPCVTRLGIYAMASEVLDVLVASGTLDGSRGCLVPKISELEVQDMDPELVFHVVASRSLKQVTLEYVRSDPPPMASLLHNRLISAGIQVRGEDGIESEEN